MVTEYVIMCSRVSLTGVNIIGEEGEEVTFMEEYCRILYFNISKYYPDNVISLAWETHEYYYKYGNRIFS